MKISRILVPVDFGESSKRALDLAIDLAKQYDASLTILHAWEVPALAYNGMEFMTVDIVSQLEDAAHAALEELLADTRKQLPGAKGLLTRGAPWREVLRVIEETHPDIVVMGTHGRRGIGRALLGSVAEKIVRTSPSPVLTVRGS